MNGLHSTTARVLSEAGEFERADPRAACRNRNEPSKVFRRTGRVRLVLVLIVVAATSDLARALGIGLNPDATLIPIRVNHLAYDKDGKLGAAPDSVRRSAASLFFGESVTNVEFRAEFSAAPREQRASRILPDAAATGSRRNVPPRPFQPQYRVDRWDGEHGLPANKVNALLQTRDGYLWIGTVGGLARFDGVRFAVFNDANTPEMRTNGTIGRTLFEDDHRRLWIGTERGILCYSAGRFIAFPGQAEVRGRDVRCIALRSAGGFWFGADGRLGYWDGSTIQWQLDLESDSEAEKRVMALAEGTDGALWIGTFGGLWKADLNSGKVKRIPLGTRLSEGIRSLLLDRRRNLWIGSSVGVWRLEPGASEPRSITDREPAFREAPHSAAFFEDSDGTIWATTSFWDGVFRLHEASSKIVMTQVAKEVNATSCVLVDREGAVWLGSQDQGLFRLRRESFTTLAFGGESIVDEMRSRRASSHGAAVSGGDQALDEMRSVSESEDGSLWFASRACVGRWSGREITLFDVRAMGGRHNSPVIVLPSGLARTSFPDRGLFELPESANDPRAFRPAVPLFPDIGEAQTMLVRGDGSFLIGTAKGLYHIKAATAAERIDALLHTDVRALLEDRTKNLWVGTGGGGLICLTPNGVHAYTSRDGLTGDQVGALHESDDGGLWVGTDTGLCRFRDGRVAGFTPDSGVPQQPIHCILEDDFGRIWLSHAAGIARVARTELEAWLHDRSRMPAVADFGTMDGILNLESTGGSQPAGLKARDGRLWFPTRRGLVVVDPAVCPTNSPSPRVLIESAVANGQTLPVDASPEVPPGRGRALEIRFTATSLHSPEKVRIRYRLDPHDPAWREAGSVRLATYAGLQPGQYAFRMQARNHEGCWSERDAVFAFRLAPYFWQTWQFYSACVLAFAGSAGGFMVWRLRQQHLRLETQRLQALERERERIARDMHDHLGPQLAGLALSAAENGTAHQRAREALREVNDLIWSVHPGNDTLPSLVDFVANFASRYLSTAGVGLDLDMPDRIPPVPIPSRLRHEVAGMFKEALRNVTQHAHAKRVTVALAIEGERLVLSVRDDGDGFDSSARQNSAERADEGEIGPQTAEGNGMRNFRARSESLGGCCRIQSTPGRGTEVQFIVPLNASSD
jgi:ligand-binding sensor domain-containing protein/signal transduction histidine kinase